jgi:hypothetical protein
MHCQTSAGLTTRGTRRPAPRQTRAGVLADSGQALGPKRKPGGRARRSCKGTIPAVSPGADLASPLSPFRHSCPRCRFRAERQSTVPAEQRYAARPHYLAAGPCGSTAYARGWITGLVSGPRLLVSLWDVKGVDGSSVRTRPDVAGGAWARCGAGWCPRTPMLTSALDAGWFRAGYMMWSGGPADALRPLSLARPFPERRGRQRGFGNWPRFIDDRWACRVTACVVQMVTGSSAWSPRPRSTW